MRLIGDEKKLEKIRCEFEAMLTVLTARIMVAKDEKDWETIHKQSMTLVRVARRGFFEAELLTK